MFKKTLIAVAVMVGVTAPAFADVSIENANTFNTTSIAYVTKQPTLSVTVHREDVDNNSSGSG
ncbi:hypothetical protein FED29_019295 [Aeromonas veronii]|nr:hypothetical protein [Aeromonas veronii]